MPEPTTVTLDGCVLLTPEGQREVAKNDRLRRDLEDRVRHLEYTFLTACTDVCELDCDGMGGRAVHCRACPDHPLRQGDPAEAISRYLGPPRGGVS